MSAPNAHPDATPAGNEETTSSPKQEDLPIYRKQAEATHSHSFNDQLNEVANSSDFRAKPAQVREPFIHDDQLNDLHSTEETPPTDALTQETKPNCFTPLLNLFRIIIPYGSLAANIFSFSSVTLGAGIISMPSAFATSGIVMAVIYLVVINIITIYTITLMGYAIDITGYRNYEEMARGLFGRGWDYFVGFIVWLSCFGTAVAYISGVGSLITPILNKTEGTPEYLKSDNGIRLLTAVIWLLFMVPIVVPKRINSLRYVSAVGVTMVLYFVVTIVVHSSANGLTKGMRGDMKYFTTGNEAIYGLSIFIFAFLSQCITYSVYLEQRPRPSVKKLTVAAAVSMTLCMVLYILAGIFGYFDFGDGIEDAILENFDPVHQPYMMVAYVGMLIKLCCAFAMNGIPMRDFLYYCLKWELDTTPYWKHTILVLSMASVTLVCGLFIPSINLALGLVGSCCGAFISFIFPALFWMYAGNWSLRTVGLWHYLACYFLLVGGVIALVFGTIATIYSSFFDK